MKIISVVGARPNFMKIAPFIKSIHEVNTAFSRLSEEDTSIRSAGKREVGVNKQQFANNKQIEHLLVHTGQHYDDRMSKAFFESLGIPEADINLGIGSGTHAEQVGHTMIAFEKVLLKEKPDWVVVVGDVNATLACSVSAKKLHIKVCHIEAGLRSGDERMPEEINRLVTDRLSDLLLVPDRLSAENLRREGVPEEKIRFVGNIMIDTLESNRNSASALFIEEILKENSLEGERVKTIETDKRYAVLTLHRPSNVDKKEILEPIVDFLTTEVARDMPMIWPIHPRTQKMLMEFDLWGKVQN